MLLCIMYRTIDNEWAKHMPPIGLYHGLYAMNAIF